MNIKKTLKNIPFLKLTPILILGVLFGHKLGVDYSFLCLFLVIPLAIITIKFRKLFIYPTLFFLGSSLIWLHQKEEIPVHCNSLSCFVVDKQVSKTSYQCSLISVDSVAFNDGILIVNHKNNLLELNIGDTVITQTNFALLKYSNERTKQKLIFNGYEYYSKIYKDESIIIKGIPVPREIGFEKKASNFISERLDSLSCSNEYKQILKATIIGDKSGIKYDIKLKYRNCGASHLLVISGWHIGIIFMILNISLIFFNFIKYGKYIKSIIIIIIIWLYAAMIGFTPSVCRAALMFTFFQYSLIATIGRNLRYNIIFSSLFLFICYDYKYIFDVGFQLSYTAVLSIQMFYGRFYGLFRRMKFIYSYKYFLPIRWILKAFAFSLSVQVLLLPLVLYYFGNYSLISPITNIALSLTFPLLIISAFLYCAYPCDFFDSIVNLTANLNGNTIDAFNNPELYVISGQFISLYDIFAYYSIMLILIYLFKKQ